MWSVLGPETQEIPGSVAPGQACHTDYTRARHPTVSRLLGQLVPQAARHFGQLSFRVYGSQAACRASWPESLEALSSLVIGQSAWQGCPGTADPGIPGSQQPIREICNGNLLPFFGSLSNKIPVCETLWI